MAEEIYQIITFYEFKRLENLPEIKAELVAAMNELSVKGTIIIAVEGFNSTVSGLRSDVEKFIEILEKVFDGFKMSYEIQGDFKPRNYCVQYYESDFDFASRLMEEEGIYYFFEHSGKRETMVLANTPQSHRDCPGKSELEYYLKVLEKDVFVSSIKNFEIAYRLQSGKVTDWDHHFQLHSNKLATEQSSVFNVGGNRNLEIYEYPGGYAKKYDCINRGGGESVCHLENVFPDKQTTIKHRMGALDAGYRTATGFGTFCGMTGGYKFKLKGHPTAKNNTQYIITRITHTADQNPSYTTIGGDESELPEPYTNEFTVIAHGAGQPPYIPPLPGVESDFNPIIFAFSGNL